MLINPVYAQNTAAPATTAASANIRFTAKETDSYARLLLNWSGANSSETRAVINGPLLIISSSKPMTGNPSVLKDQAPSFIAAVALSADKKTIRIALTKNVRIVRSKEGATEAIDLVMDGAGDPPPYSKSADATAAAPKVVENKAVDTTTMPLVNRPAPIGAPRVNLTATENKGFTRLTLSAQNLPKHSFSRKGDRMALTLPGLHALDIASVRTNLPAKVKGLVRFNNMSHTSLVFDVTPGAVVRDRREGELINIDIFPAGTDLNPKAEKEAEKQDNNKKPDTKAKADETKTAEVAHSKEPSDGKPSGDTHESTNKEKSSEIGLTIAKPEFTDPAPSGTVEVKIKEVKPELVLDFGFEANAPAAIFRRGGNIFILFATNANFNVNNLKPTPMATGFKPVKGDNVSGIKISAPDSTIAVPMSLGQHWYITLSNTKTPNSRLITLISERAADDSNRIKANVPDAITKGSFIDEDVGDKLLVGMALGPPSGLHAQRSFLEAMMPQTWHGLAVVPRTDDLEIREAIDGFVVVRPNGLELSTGEFAPAPTGFVAQSPGFVNFKDWKLGPAADFVRNLDKLKREASKEFNDPSKGINSQLNLARFYLAWEMAPEALGQVKNIKTTNPSAMRDPEVLAIQGIAQTMMNRGREALETLSSLEIEQDPASQLWAAVAALAAGDPAEARKRFERGQSALTGFTTEQQAKFLITEATAAIQLGDYPAAASLASRAQNLATEKLTKELAELTKAIGQGHSHQYVDAFKALDTLEQSKFKEIAARATYNKAMLKVLQNPSQIADAVRALDGLRYSWRGDDLELDILRNLGELYIKAGDIRSGLSTLADASTLRPELPAARALRTVLVNEFRHLFLEGGADGMDPIQALALFYDFRNLTPVGPEGDQMARGLADRLVALDLLPQATELLKHQVDNRLEGFAKSQVATDLAAIYLLDTKPEEAIKTLWASRLSQLPPALNNERKLIEAISMTNLNRHDHALELLEFDDSSAAAQVKAEVYWRKGDYVNASVFANQTLPPAGPKLTPDQAADVLRATLAKSLSGDRAGAIAMAKPYGAAMQNSSLAEAFKIATTNDIPNSKQIQAAVNSVRGASPFGRLIKEMRTRVAEVSSPEIERTVVYSGPTDGNPNGFKNNIIDTRKASEVAEVPETQEVVNNKAAPASKTVVNTKQAPKAKQVQTASTRPSAPKAKQVQTANTRPKAPKQRPVQTASAPRTQQASNGGSRLQAPQDPPVMGAR